MKIHTILFAWGCSQTDKQTDGHTDRRTEAITYPPSFGGGNYWMAKYINITFASIRHVYTKKSDRNKIRWYTEVAKLGIGAKASSPIRVFDIVPWHHYYMPWPQAIYDITKGEGVALPCVVVAQLMWLFSKIIQKKQSGKSSYKWPAYMFYLCQIRSLYWAHNISNESSKRPIKIVSASPVNSMKKKN